MSHQLRLQESIGFVSNKHRSKELFKHVLALELPRLSIERQVKNPPVNSSSKP